MVISPTKCPICNKLSVYAGRCSNCWWIEPRVLHQMAESYKQFAEAWDPEKQQLRHEIKFINETKERVK